MRVLVSTESRFDCTSDGTCWNVGWAGYGFWQRYLDAFDEVRILARVRPVAEPPPDAVAVTGPSVSLVPLPYYLGPWDFLRNRRSLGRAVRDAVQGDDGIILRAPGAVTGLVAEAMRGGRPYGIEVVGDPYDVFAPGGVRTVLRPLLRRVMSRQLRAQCLTACAAAYVTAGSLQRRYPAAPASFVTRYSSIDLPEGAFVSEARQFTRGPGTTRQLVFVGSLEQLYKGPDVLIEAIALAARDGLPLQLTMIGDGKHRVELEAHARSRGVADRIRFVGHLPPGQAIRTHLDAADLFVLPSRTEGLPRALIEAMARAVPCVGSDVGGIPELLAPAERVPPGDAAALSATLLAVLRDPARLTRLSEDNLHKAREYHVACLRPRRQAFYGAVRQATEQWQAARPLTRSERPHQTRSSSAKFTRYVLPLNSTSRDSRRLVAQCSSTRFTRLRAFAAPDATTPVRAGW